MRYKTTCLIEDGVGGDEGVGAEVGGVGEGGVLEVACAADVEVAALQAGVLEGVDGRLAALADGLVRLVLRHRGQLVARHDALERRRVVRHLHRRRPAVRRRGALPAHRHRLHRPPPLLPRGARLLRLPALPGLGRRRRLVPRSVRRSAVHG